MKDIWENELKREEMLAKDEELLKLKRKAIWINEGDNKTNFFHNFATHRRNLNTISSIKDMNGDMVRYFKAKKEAGERFFKNLFKKPEGVIFRKYQMSSTCFED